MKKTSLLIFFVFLLMPVTFSQDLEKYKFPITSSDVEWKTNSYPERLKILQIEEEVLINLSNIQLIGACYDFPYTINLFAFNSLEEGYSNVYSIFNGLRELHTREDIGDDLVFFYSKLGLNGFEKELETYNENFEWMTLPFIEILLSREDIIAKMDNTQKGNLVDECIKKYNAKEAEKDPFTGEAVYRVLSHL